MAGHKVYTSSRDWVDNLQTQDYLAELLRQMDYLRDDLINQENFESVEAVGVKSIEILSKIQGLNLAIEMMKPLEPEEDNESEQH
jgi:hypothetical protein